MAALGGADQPGLAEQIQLLREQNNLLVQQNLQLQQGRPAARVQPQPERRRFLEPPTEADLDEQRLYLIPAIPAPLCGLGYCAAQLHSRARSCLPRCDAFL